MRSSSLCDLLGSVGANPVVAFSQAVAVTERDGPEQGLAALEAIFGLERSHIRHPARVDPYDGSAGRQRLPGTWKPPTLAPTWASGGCFCPVSSI